MIAQIVVTGAMLYAAIGLLFGVVFIGFGVGRVDLAASRATPGFRLLILPGVAALWPLFLLRWARRQGPPREQGPHHRRDAK